MLHFVKCSPMSKKVDQHSCSAQWLFTLGASRTLLRARTHAVTVTIWNQLPTYTQITVCIDFMTLQPLHPDNKCLQGLTPCSLHPGNAASDAGSRSHLLSLSPCVHLAPVFLLALAISIRLSSLLLSGLWLPSCLVPIFCFCLFCFGVT